MGSGDGHEPGARSVEGFQVASQIWMRREITAGGEGNLHFLHSGSASWVWVPRLWLAGWVPAFDVSR